MKVNHCAFCGAPIYGRSDKKYCSITCKDDLNNKKKRQWNTRLCETVDKMELNYSILKMYCGKKKGIPLSELDALGFSADICTAFRKEGTKNICRCFNIEYKLSKQKIYDIRLLL